MKINVTLQPHQEYLLEKMKNQYEKSGNLRYVIAHTMGTGKTVSMLALSKYLLEKEPDKKIIFISPKSLMGNFTNTVKSMSEGIKVRELNNEKDLESIKDDNHIHVISNDFFRRFGDKLIDSNLYNTIIIDESHYYRNPKSKLTQKLFEISPKIKNLVLSTGSIINNRPEELGVYLHILLGDKFPYGSNYQQFAEEFIEPIKKRMFKKQDRSQFAKSLAEGKFKIENIPPLYNIKKIQELGEIIKNHFDYIDIDAFKHKMPKKIEENIEVCMSPEQEDYFVNYVNGSFKELHKLRQEGVPNEVLRKIFKINFTRLRQISNSVSLINPDIKPQDEWKYSPKIKKMVEDIENILSENENNRVVVYGSFINAGLIPLLKGLEQKNINAFLFSGDASKEERDQSVKDFNSGKIRVMLISPAGIEGISLNTGTHMLIMDPHPNPEKQKQTEARIIRMNSIPKEVKIIRYFAVPSKEENRKKTLIYGVDWSLMGLAKYKELYQQPIRKLLMEVSSNPKVAISIPYYETYFTLITFLLE
jgi:thymidine kinase